ncbi:hypothetical protein XELAEV_180315283mg, partial [Xenopus laevis]
PDLVSIFLYSSSVIMSSEQTQHLRKYSSLPVWVVEDHHD